MVATEQRQRYIHNAAKLTAYELQDWDKLEAVNLVSHIFQPATVKIKKYLCT